MRKIDNWRNIEEKRKKRNKAFTFFLLGMLVLSSIGYAFFSSPNERSNNSGNANGNYVIQFGEQTHYLSNSPQDVKDVKISITKKLADYAGNVVYVSIESPIIRDEISSNIGRYVSRLQDACYGNCSDSNLVEKDCNSDLIIWLKKENNRVYQDNKCIFIEGDLKSVDAFLYKIFGII